MTLIKKKTMNEIDGFLHSKVDKKSTVKDVIGEIGFETA